MAIDNIKKSSRLLQSRRYTHDSFTDAQEAFTSTLDINANEIYVDQNLIPSASLPFSGSSQSGSVYSVSSQSVMKYHYRVPMTRSNLVSGSANEVWFFLLPTGSNAGIGAQLIDSNQQVNFISPKYSVPALSNATAEDSTPGYGVKVFVSTNATAPSAGDQISVNNYSFDYKTGVLQFTTNAVSATTSQYVYISAYQYIGRVLKDTLVTLSSTGSNTFTGNQIISGTLFVSSSFTASLQSGYAWVGDGNNLSRAVATASFSTPAAAGTISGSSQVIITQTTGYTTFSQSLAGTDASQSADIIIISQSAWGAFQSASAYSASAAIVDGRQDLRLNSLENFTSSIAGTNTFTQSAVLRLNALENTSASVIGRVNSIETFTASIAGTNTFTQSAITRLSNLEIRTGSYTTTSSFNSFTQSYYVDSASFDTRIKSALAGATPPGTVSGSIQVDITQTTGYTVFSQSLAGTDFSQSVSILLSSQSAFGAFQSASAYSASAAVVDGRQDLRLNSLESVTASIAGINTFTSSIAGTNTFTASIVGTNLFTQSAILRLNALETSSASVIARLGNLETFTGSFSASNFQINATQSAKLNSLETFTSSIAGTNVFTQSVSNSITALNLSTSSLNSKTGSYATTGSNTFIGNQTITGSTAISGSLSILSSGSNIFRIDGTSGRLFSVDDTLSGSLYSVNNVSGLPIIEVFSDNTVRIGQFGQRVLYVSQSRVGIGKEIALNANLDVSGSAIVTGSLIVSGTFTASLQSGFALVGDGNGFSRPVATSSFAGTTPAGTVSGSSQIDITQTTGYTVFSQSLAGTDFSQSVSILLSSQSAFGAFQSASAYSASAAVVDGRQDLRLNSLENFTASISNINAFTQSVSNSLTALNLSTASVNSKTGSYATTGSNTFIGNQIISGNVFITSSLIIGSASVSNENTLIIGVPLNGIAAGEGGQLLLAAPMSGGFTSASMLDNYQNRFRVLRGTNAGSDAEIASFNMHTGQLVMSRYTGSGAFTASVVALLGIDTAGNVLTTTVSSGGGGGATSPGGTNTQIQYNNSSTFGGVPVLTYDGTTLRASGSFTGSFTGSLLSNNGIFSGSSQIILSSTTGYTTFSQSLAGTDASQSVDITTVSQSAFGTFQSASAYSASTAVVDGRQDLRLNSLENFTASIAGTNIFTASIAGTNTFTQSVSNSLTALNLSTSSLNSKTGSYATTGSNTFIGNQTVNGNLNISGSNYSYTAFSTTIGSNTISSIATGSYNGAFYNYVAISASNARAGQISAIWLGNTITYTETTTTDIGTTNGVSMVVQISNGLVQLVGTTNSAPWTIKTSINLI